MSGDSPPILPIGLRALIVVVPLVDLPVTVFNHDGFGSLEDCLRALL